MTNDEAYSLFQQAGALLSGHFLLSSGLHSDAYLEKFRLVERPTMLEALCQSLAAKFKPEDIDLVLGPTTAGIILAYEVARILGKEARYAEKEDGERKLRRGQSLEPGTRVLVVDDILTTGGAVRECVDLLDREGAILAGVAVLADRSGGKVTFSSRLEAALTLDVKAWQAEECPLCRQGEPLTKPGTSKR